MNMTRTTAWSISIKYRTATQVGHYNCDAINRRSRRQTLNSAMPNFIHEYLYQGWQCMETRDDSNTLLNQYVWGQYLDELIQQKNYTAVNGFASNATLYPMQDLLYRTNCAGEHERRGVGSVRYGRVWEYANFQKSADAPGDATRRPGVIAWTNDDTQVPVPTCDFIFTGQRYDFESGLYYYKNRYYSAGLGRFLTRDPMGRFF